MSARTHSLTAAVAQHVVTDYAAFCGLAPADIAALMEAGFGSSRILVHLRTHESDSRTVVTVDEFTAAVAIGEIAGFRYGDVRTVTAVAGT